MNQPTQFRFNVLEWRPLRFLVKNSIFPLGFQAGVLGIMLWLARNGLNIGRGVLLAELMILRKTNLTTLLVWGLWWPGMITAAVFLGRVWCTVCPLELVNRVGGGFARWLRLPRATLGKMLRSGWFVLAGYLVLQLLVAGISLHRVPHYTAILLLFLISAALLTGLIFRDSRSFCKAFCPAGALLSVYSRNSAIQLDTKNPSLCSHCTTRDCIRAENRNRLDKRSCPSLLRPFQREPSDGCVLCMQCAKVCPSENVGFGWVSKTASIQQKSLLRPFESAFVFVALGFVAHEIIGEVKWLDSIFHRAPEFLSQFWPALPMEWFEAYWFLILFPVGIWAIIAAFSYLTGHRRGIGSLLVSASTGAAPVIAMAHVAKASAKILSWAGFMPLALKDPQGIKTLHQISGGLIVSPALPLGIPVIGWGMLCLTLFMVWKRWSNIFQGTLVSTIAARAGLIGTSFLFCTLLTIWGAFST